MFWIKLFFGDIEISLMAGCRRGRKSRPLSQCFSLFYTHSNNMLSHSPETTRITHHMDDDDGSPKSFLSLTTDSFANEVSSIKLNPQVIVSDWSQSWNPANGGPDKYIDMNCLKRIKNAMGHFRYKGTDIPQQFTNFDEMRAWLLQYVLKRHPYDLLYGHIFLEYPQDFQFKKRSFSSKFQSLDKLENDEREKFSDTLFISWNVLTDLFEGKEISGLFSNVSNSKGDYIFRIKRLPKKRRDQETDRRLRRSQVSRHSNQPNDQRFVVDYHPLADEECDSIGRRTKRRRTTNDIVTKDEN